MQDATNAVPAFARKSERIELDAIQRNLANMRERDIKNQIEGPRCRNQCADTGRNIPKGIGQEWPCRMPYETDGYGAANARFVVPL
jgi:hypothetical protein